MKCLLLYYTGTYNTRYLTRKLKKKLEDKGAIVDVYEIDPLNNQSLDYSDYDLLGLGYPIYGFNAPLPFLRFIRNQRFGKPIKTFIYKNSGETYSANDASSISVLRHLRKEGVKVDNEYHFIMPYNIHFKFDENLVREMLDIDDMLLDILVKEVLSGIPNIKKYRLIDKFITWAVKLQFIGGPVNSFFYKVDKDKCINCNKCIKDCPTKNIYRNKNGKICFHHNCLMCMRCSMMCPKDCIHIGFLEGWRVNGAYDFNKIENIKLDKAIITKDTEGFFRCYIKTYEDTKKRCHELFETQEIQ